jgi:hypothetical protein
VNNIGLLLKRKRDNDLEPIPERKMMRSNSFTCISKNFKISLVYIYIYIKENSIYTGCNRRKGPNFGRVFLMLNYTEKTQNTYVQS